MEETWSARACDVGANRWAANPELGFLIPLSSKWSLELEGGARLFGDDDDFLPGKREQTPIFACGLGRQTSNVNSEWKFRFQHCAAQNVEYLNCMPLSKTTHDIWLERDVLKAAPQPARSARHALET